MYVARDKDGDLWLYEKKPIKSELGVWQTDDENMHISSVNPVLFQEVSWEDEEPRELVLKPINKE